MCQQRCAFIAQDDRSDCNGDVRQRNICPTTTPMWRQLVRTIITGGKNDRCRAAITENAL
jgi:hypothetical protein